MPKVLHINSYSGTGSIGRIIDQINLKASDAGWDCYVASGSRYSKNTLTKRIKFSNCISEYLHYLISLLGDRQGHGSYLETKSLLRKINSLAPDLIHIHNLHGYYLHVPLLMQYLIKTNIPVVWTFHDCWNITGHCAYFDYVGCDRWMNEGCHHCPQKSSYPASLGLDNSESNYKEKKRLFLALRNIQIVTVSDWLNSVVRQSFLKNNHIETIYNGIDLEVFKYNSLAHLNLHSDCDFVLLGVAAIWSPRKGLSDFIQLRKILPRNYKIVLIGLSNQQIRSLPEGMIGIQRTTNVKELVDYYSSCDVVLNLSYEETLGMTSIEGYACGKPTIVYDRTASPELVTSETGYVVEAGNITKLAEKVQYMCRNLSSFCSVNCRRRAEVMFNKDSCFSRYVEIYNRILNDSTSY